MVSNLQPTYQEKMQALVNDAPPTTYDRDGWETFIKSMNLDLLSPGRESAMMIGGALCVHAGSSRGTHFSKYIEEGTHAHELGHQLDMWMLMPEHRGRNIDLYTNAKKRREAVTKYALTNTGEYFAENCRAYIYNPVVLEDKDPDAYQFMQEFFQ